MNKFLIATLLAFALPAFAQSEAAKAKVIGAFTLPPPGQCTSVIQEFREGGGRYKVLIVVCRSKSDSRMSVTSEIISPASRW